MATQFCEELHWDLMSKKVDVIEGQLRKIEKDHEKVVNVLRGEVELKEKANEFQKELSKQQKQLKQDIINLSGRIDLLQSNESTIKALSAHSVHFHPTAENHFGVTAKDVEEMVQQRVQQEVARAMEVALQALAKEQANQKAMPHHYNNSYTALKKDHHSTEEMTKIKNEQFKLMGEIERLKSRQTYVEGVCRDVSPSAIKNIDATESNKKGLDSLRKECDDLFHALSNSLSEMNMTLLTNKSQTSQLQSVVAALEAHAKHTEQVLAQFDSKLTTFNQFKQESTDIVNKVHDQSEYLYAKVTIVENTLETHRVNIVGEVEKRLKVCESSCRRDLETSLKEITDDFNKSMSGMTDAYNLQHQRTLEAVEKHHNQLATSLTEKVEATQQQLSEMNLNAERLERMKTAIDSVLSEIDQRAQTDASWSYNFNSLLQKCEIRLKSLEELVPLCQKNELELSDLQSAVEDQGKLLADAAVKTDTLFKDLQTTLQNFKDDIHASLINSDEQNVHQFNAIDDMIVKIVNDIPILIERAQSDTFEMAIDKQTLLREEVMQHVEKSNHELYDTLLVAMETPLKETTDDLSNLIRTSTENLIQKFDARVQANVKEAMDAYQTQLSPLLDVEDRLVTRLDENLEVMRENTEIAMKMLASHLKKVEASVLASHSRLLDESHTSGTSPSRRDISTSTSSYPSVSIHSGSDGSGTDHMRVVHPTSTLPATVVNGGADGGRYGSPESHGSEDSTPLQNVSHLVYQSPSRPKSATGVSPMFGDLSELGTRVSAPGDEGQHNQSGSHAMASSSYFIPGESEFDVSHFVGSSQSNSLSQLHTTSSMFDSSIHSSQISAAISSSNSFGHRGIAAVSPLSSSAIGPAPASAVSGSRLPPKISVKSPPKSSLVFLTSTHYGSSAVADMSPDFSVSSLLSHHSESDVVPNSRAVHPSAIVTAGISASPTHRSPRAVDASTSAVSTSHVVRMKSESVQTSTSPTSESLNSPSDSGSSSGSEDSPSPNAHLLHESFADFNHIIDTVNTDIRALDLHLHDLTEGVVAVAAPPVSNSISPIKAKQRYNAPDEEGFSDSTSDADDVLRSSFLGERNMSGSNGKEDLDLTAVETAQMKEAQKQKALFDLYQKKLNHRKKFQRNLKGM